MNEARQLPERSVGTDARGNPYWLVARRKRGGLEVMTTALADGRRLLPVFSFEKEASMYLHRSSQGSWGLRPTRPGELVSLLCSLYRKIELVALDPVSDVETDVVNLSVSLKRERFVNVLLHKVASTPPRVPRHPGCGRSLQARTTGTALWTSGGES